MEPASFAYESMGTHWKVSVWDPVSATELDRIRKQVEADSTDFDQTYSRFIKSSLIWSLATKTGVQEVPKDLVAMLRLYEQFFDLSGGKCNPLIGFSLSDLGYDAEYSLVPLTTVRKPPNLHEAVHIVDDEHIELQERTLIDVGALGKGFFVDKIAAYLRQNGLTHFLVDGSGDMSHRGPEPLRVGLEDPGDEHKVIGVIDLQNRAMCGSGGNRRAWRGQHHIIDPLSLKPADAILAAWVIADTTAVADALATCLFFAPPEAFAAAGPFEYCLLNREYKVKRSAGFTAELF